MGHGPEDISSQSNENIESICKGFSGGKKTFAIFSIVIIVFCIRFVVVVVVFVLLSQSLNTFDSIDLLERIQLVQDWSLENERIFVRWDLVMDKRM